MKFVTLVALAAAIPAAALAQSQSRVEMNAIDAKGVGKSLGTITIIEGAPGGSVVLKPDLKGLPPGPHGFHIHELANCGPKEKDGKMAAGEMAGPPWDPDKTGKHGAPTGGGHKGDMPVLLVGANGSATQVVAVPRLKLADFRGRSLMIHAGGDNHADQPQPNGGGGERIACGVVEAAKKR
jgi:Cu-Zn family superoxide dismutase